MMTFLTTRMRVAAVVAMLLGAAAGGRGQPGSTPTDNTAMQPDPSSMTSDRRGQSGALNQGNAQMERMQSMSCTCPSVLHGAAGVVALAVGGVLAGSAAAASIALTVFLVRRSRHISPT